MRQTRVADRGRQDPAKGLTFGLDTSAAELPQREMYDVARNTRGTLAFLPLVAEVEYPVLPA